MTESNKSPMSLVKRAAKEIRKGRGECSKEGRRKKGKIEEE